MRRYAVAVAVLIQVPGLSAVGRADILADWDRHVPRGAMSSHSMALVASRVAAVAQRRGLLFETVAEAAVGAAALVIPSLAGGQSGDQGDNVAAIHQLQADFHLAKSTQDINLMMSLWANDAIFVVNGVSFAGKDAIKAFLLTTGSFTHRRLSLVPSFKIQIAVQGDYAFLYFECVDIGTYDTSPFVASVLWNAGTVHKVHGKWLFWHMNGGLASPLSVEHYYFP